MDRNQVAIELFRVWKENKCSGSYYNELPDEIQNIENPLLRRVYVLFYCALARRRSIKSRMEPIRQLENIKPKTTRKLITNNWTGPVDRLNPVEIARASSIEIKSCLKNKITLKAAQNIKNLAVYIVEYNEIPTTVLSLLGFSLINTFKANMIMYNAWNDANEIGLSIPMSRVLYRLGWLEGIEVKHIDTLYRYVKLDYVKAARIKSIVEGLFSFKLWRIVMPGFDHHGVTICKREPLCGQCIFKEQCPSNRETNEIATYLDELQSQGYFPEEKTPYKNEHKDKVQIEEKQLLSYSEPEEEDMSDI
ncbi:hypothetical protein NEAUS05_0898 [Nematocida ausubeli]|nr:hypothetical protein NEAUS05_0898 [Nematocida ausubeli]